MVKKIVPAAAAAPVVPPGPADCQECGRENAAIHQAKLPACLECVLRQLAVAKVDAKVAKKTRRKADREDRAALYAGRVIAHRERMAREHPYLDDPALMATPSRPTINWRFWFWACAWIVSVIHLAWNYLPAALA